MDSMIPNGSEIVRPFLPAMDIGASKAFYEALGFKKLLDGDVVIFAMGATSFILTRFYEKSLAENHMMQLMVDDLDAWWRHVVSLDLPAKFQVAEPKAPKLQPWGLRVAYIYDPCGVLWHIAERRPGNPAD